jgi:collagen type I/II/III/V/XI/XXIV/XXVII alpha
VGGTAPCFAKGTRIATDRGEVPVESLRVGDRVRTVLDDDMQEIVWIGHRRADCTRHPKPKAIWPVRISAGAFGAGRPSRDLFLSPDHSVYANEVLIPVKRLINGTTIVQVPVDEVAYFHVLLPRHEVLLADGLTVESYLDTGDRADFANGGVSIALHPELAARFWEAMGCAPLMVVGPEVTAVKRLLAARARQIARAARLPGRQHGKRNGATAVARRAGGLAA